MTHKQYFCPKCQISWKGTFDYCPNCGNKEVYTSIVSTTEFPTLITSSDIGTCLSESEKWDINTNEIESIQINDIEYKKVKHGRWIDFHCTVCGKVGWSDEDDYCPNCGASMIDEENIENESV